MKDLTRCPNGHLVSWGDPGQPPECGTCELVATHYSTRTNEVYDWMAYEDYLEASRNLQDQMDEAFDNQYFNDGGW